MRILRQSRLRRPQPVRPLPGHPSRGGPRPARGVAVRPARAGLHRRCSRRCRGCTSTAAPTASRAASSAGCARTRAPGSATSSSTSRSSCRTSPATPVTFGKTRGAGEPGHYHVVYEYEQEDVGLEAGRAGHAACSHSLLPPELRPAGCDARATSTSRAERDEFIRFAQRRGTGPEHGVARARGRGRATSRGSASTSRA